MPRVYRCALWMLALLVVASSMACSSGKRAKTSYDTGRYISEHDLKRLPTSNIPIVVNERVIAWMEYFTGAGRKHFKRYLERSGRFLPLMQAILREQGMPSDLVYISLIESGFNTHAYSRAAAVGPWQFIGSTGRIYGLKQDGWVDERRDPIRATYAAAKLFRDLYNDYGDWYLAMVGYNAGPGRVKKAMQITGSKDFWVMADDKHALRAETRDYVPKYIAATIIAKSPEKFGFTDITYQDPWEHESATVETQTDLSVIAKCAGVSEDTIFDLNPHLVRGATPPGERNYRVRLPKGTTQKFQLAYAKVPEDERIQIIRHKVRRGDTMYRIARKYGVGVNALASANGLSRRSKLHRGKTLIIPVGSGAKYAKYDRGSSGSSRSHKSKVIRYKVRRGDTLGGIAAKYPGVTVAKLKKWNRIKRSHIRVGQRLKIYTRGSSRSYASAGSSGGGSKPKYHKVRRGETLGSIAAKYGTSTKELMALNGIKNPRSLKAGKRIKVRGGSSASAPSSSSGGAVALSGPTGTYKVRPGDTPGTIAQKFGMSTKALMAMNGIRDAKSLKAGKKLRVKASGSGSSSETTAIPLDETEVSSESSVKRVASSSGGKHKVRSGESVSTIAQKYGMSSKELMAINGIKNPRSLRAGQTLKVAGGSSSESSGKTTAIALNAQSSGSSGGSSTTHRVASGETLGGIAAKYGVSTRDLMAWNGIKNPKGLRAGQKLIVKGKKKSASAPQKSSAPKEAGTPIKLASADTPTVRATQNSAVSNPRAKPSSVTYRVKSGESLWTIARKHNVTIAQLQKWNNLSDPSAVRAGTTLKIMKN